MAYLNAYRMSLNTGDGIKEEFNLRLNIRAILALKKKYKVNSELDLILKAVDDIEVVMDIFSAALSYKDNENSITDGTDFYELLVDNGYKGAESFASVIFEIASASGFIKEEQKDKLSQTINNTYDNIFNNLEDNVNEQMERLSEEYINSQTDVSTFR